MAVNLTDTPRLTEEIATARRARRNSLVNVASELGIARLLTASNSEVRDLAVALVVTKSEAHKHDEQIAHEVWAVRDDIASIDDMLGQADTDGTVMDRLRALESERHALDQAVRDLELHCALDRRGADPDGMDPPDPIDRVELERHLAYLGERAVAAGVSFADFAALASEVPAYAAPDPDDRPF